MKLLIVSSWFPYPPDNGSKQRVFALLRSLSQHHRLTLLSFREGPDQDAEPLKALCAAVHTVPGNPFKPRRPLERMAFFSNVPRSYKGTYDPAMQKLVDDLLPEQELAIALQIGSAMYLRGRSALPRLFEEAEVGVIRDQFTNQATALQRIRYGATWLKYARFIRALVDEFDRTTVVSELEREHLRQAGCDLEKVRVLPNGTDVPESLPTVTRQPTTLIYPGSLTYSANLDAVQYFLADIWPRIRQATPGVKFVVTGSTAGVVLNDLPHREGVVFTGQVANIEEVIAASTVSVVPIRLGGGTRLKILQSMALGTPVISTSKGAEGLSVHADHDILIGDTPEQFAAHVARLLSDRALQARLSAAGRDLASRRYAWPAIGMELEALLQETVEVFRHGQR